MPSDGYLHLDRHARGRFAEKLVGEYLEDRGFTLLAHNLRLGYLEVDLVARRGELAVMVEVRARGRGAFERPLASLASTKKRMYLLNAADRLWRRHLAALPGVERMRIDVAAVDLRCAPARVEYIEGALMR